MKKTFEKDKEINLPEVILKQLKKIDYGTLSIVIQDNKVLQINIDESYDFDGEEENLTEKEKRTISDYKKMVGKNINNELIHEIVQAINNIHYGCLTISVKNNRIIQFEKSEKFRVR